MYKKYIDINEAERELMSQCDSVYTLINEEVKPEDCFIKRNEAYNQKLYMSMIKSFIDFLKARSTAEVQEVRHGENITEANPVDEFICSECGYMNEDCTQKLYDEDGDYYYICEYEYKYCPNCGAKMDKE